MSTDELLGIPPISVEAGVDLSAKQFRFVDYDESNDGKLKVTGAGGSTIGVNYSKATLGQMADVHVLGAPKVEFGGTVLAGGYVKSDSVGRAVAADASDVAAGAAIGRAPEGGALNKIRRVQLIAIGMSMSAVTGQDILTNGGAISVDTVITRLQITGTDTITLADGRYVGQVKTIIVDSVGASPVGNLTINDTASGTPTTWTFTAAGQKLVLEWTADGWAAIEVVAAGADAPAAASTLNLLVLEHGIAIDGTNDWILPSGVVAGQVQKFAVISAANTPVGTISGLFYDEDASADGVDINLNAAADMATVQWNGIRWVTTELVSATVS